MFQRFTERKIISQALTTSLSAYTAFDNVGGKLTFSDTIPIHIGSGAIVGARVFDLDSQIVPYELFLFDQDPSATTFTDNAAIDVADADLPKIAGIISFATSTRFSFADNSLHYVDGLYIPIKAQPEVTTFYAALRTGTAGTPTYTSTSALTVELFMEY